MKLTNEQSNQIINGLDDISKFLPLDEERWTYVCLTYWKKGSSTNQVSVFLDGGLVTMRKKWYQFWK